MLRYVLVRDRGAHLHVPKTVFPDARFDEGRLLSLPEDEKADMLLITEKIRRLQEKPHALPFVQGAHVPDIPPMRIELQGAARLVLRLQLKRIGINSILDNGDFFSRHRIAR